MVVSTTDDFLTLVEMSRLIPAQRVAKLRSEIPVHLLHNAERIASELTRRRLLTNWQAQQILAGHTRFFYGKYKLLDQIGIGGMGVVYKAEMIAMGRVVALKMMSHDLVNNAEAVARFEREVKAAAKLNHPNVVTAYDAICEDQVYFLVLEYVHGGNVNQWLKREGPLPADWASECIRQAALGLQHAHEHGIVHRDIKPGNILVSADNTHSLPLVKILDMGLARLTHHFDSPPTEGLLTRQGQVLGTPDYIAPEQARDTRTADVRCDVFSLGVTFFKMLTGRLPYGGNTAMEKIMARTSGPAPRVSTVRRDVSPGLDAVVAKMLEIDPENRFQEPWEVAQAVSQFSIINRISRARGDQASPSSIVATAMSDMLTARGKMEADELLDPENALGDDFNPKASSTGSMSSARGNSAVQKERTQEMRPGSGVVRKPVIPGPGGYGSGVAKKPPIPGPDGKFVEPTRAIEQTPSVHEVSHYQSQIRMLVIALALVATMAMMMAVSRIMGW